jgi:Flp pilus assembly protein TadB
MEMCGVSTAYRERMSHALDPVGQKLLYAGGTFIILGGLIIRKIVNVQV